MVKKKRFVAVADWDWGLDRISSFGLRVFLFSGVIFSIFLAIFSFFWGWVRDMLLSVGTLVTGFVISYFLYIFLSVKIFYVEVKDGAEKFK